jgi:hypothetical protein
MIIRPWARNGRYTTRSGDLTVLMRHLPPSLPEEPENGSCGPRRRHFFHVRYIRPRFSPGLSYDLECPRPVPSSSAGGPRPRRYVPPAVTTVRSSAVTSPIAPAPGAGSGARSLNPQSGQHQHFRRELPAPAATTIRPGTPAPAVTAMRYQQLWKT